MDPTLCPDLIEGFGQGGPWFTQYVDREIEFVREVLGQVYPGTDHLTLWGFQQYLIEALFEHRYVAVRGCRSTGKSHAGGKYVIPTFMCTAPSQILILAPTVEQAQRVTFAKTISAFNESPTPLPGRILRRSWEIDQEHFCTIIAAKNSDNVRGHHGGTKVPIDPELDAETAEKLRQIQDAVMDSPRRLLIYCDEPQGIGEETFRVLEGMMSKPSVYGLMMGNPYLGLDDDHYYVRACKPESRWHTIKLSALSEQEVVKRGGEPDPLPADKVFDRIPEETLERAWVEEQLQFFELADPFVCSDVLGRFPSGSTSSLVIPRTALEHALFNRDARGVGPRIGVDIGLTGDRCVMCLMMDGVVHAEHEFLPDGTDRQAQVTIANEIAKMAVFWGKEMHRMYPKQWNGDPITGGRLSIDCTGLIGVGDILSEKGIECDRVLFGSSPDFQWTELLGFEQDFLNVRAEMHWLARRGLQEGVFQVPRKFRRIWQQASWVHYVMELNKDGEPRVKLEAKDDIKAAHGRSPDNLDAFVLACRETTPGNLVRGLDDRFAGKQRLTVPAGRRRLPGRGWNRI